MKPLGTAVVLAVLLLAFWPALSGWISHHKLQPIEVMVALVLGFVMLRLHMANRAPANQPPINGEQRPDVRARTNPPDGNMR